MMLHCSISSMTHTPCRITESYPQAVKCTMLHFSLAFPPRWTPQVWFSSVLCPCLLGSYQKPSQVKHGSSWVWPTQLVNPYFTENTQPGHTSVTFTTWCSSSTHSDIHLQNCLPLFSTLTLPFFLSFLSVERCSSAVGHETFTRGRWVWVGGGLVPLRWLSHTHSISLYCSVFFLKRDVELNCENRMSDSLISHLYSVGGKDYA